MIKFIVYSLISMSTVARNNGFVRPEIVHGDQKMEIRQGRHPLVEMICDFVPNSTTFNSQEKITILTGPNASGKSIYLKQVMLHFYANRQSRKLWYYNEL